MKKLVRYSKSFRHALVVGLLALIALLQYAQLHVSQAQYGLLSVQTKLMLGSAQPQPQLDIPEGPAPRDSNLLANR